MGESLEMYLITIAQLYEETGEDTVALSRLARALSLKPVSVHQMIQKIVSRGLVRYQPYKGVSLTDKGWREAQQILRNRRLWQVFLVEKLQMPIEQAVDFSCRLEHITPDGVDALLAEFLGNPTTSPLGKPIPVPHRETSAPLLVRLSTLAAGKSGVVGRVDAEPAARAFLASHGIRPGATVLVLAVANDGMMLLEAGGRQFSLAGALADKVSVENVHESADLKSNHHQMEDFPMQVKQVPLSELQPGQKGVVVRLNARGALKRRLLDMGFVNGEVVLMERKAPLGDPVEFLLQNYHISLRKEEAEQILVEVEVEEA